MKTHFLQLHLSFVLNSHGTEWHRDSSSGSYPDELRHLWISLVISNLKLYHDFSTLLSHSKAIVRVFFSGNTDKTMSMLSLYAHNNQNSFQFIPLVWMHAFIVWFSLPHFNHRGQLLTVFALFTSLLTEIIEYCDITTTGSLILSL